MVVELTISLLSGRIKFIIIMVLVKILFDLGLPGHPFGDIGQSGIPLGYRRWQVTDRSYCPFCLSSATAPQAICACPLSFWWSSMFGLWPCIQLVAGVMREQGTLTFPEHLVLPPIQTSLYVHGWVHLANAFPVFLYCCGHLLIWICSLVMTAGALSTI